MIGQSIGHYRIEEQLGAGGMGVVYLATDTKLGRQVAIKALPAACAKDPERRARFEREARLLASLSHPHIGVIHGVEEREGECFLILELVPGPTLAERLASSALSVDEALRIGRQIAEALEAAHEKGIIHRDLKPANVKITPEGVVKVLDFGLAKAFLAAPSGPIAEDGPTCTLDETREGVILGTAAYMSPEQARGRPLDKRSDIWSFGCVLYEALARKRAFHGETTSDYIAAILDQEPDWKALPAATPPAVKRLLRRCLDKEQHRRLRDIGDARIELEEALSAPARAVTEEAATRPRARSLHLAIGCVLAGALVAAMAFSLLRPPAPAAPVTRFAITLPQDEVVSPTGGPSVKLSPDGTKLVWVGEHVSGRRQIYSRRLDQLETKAVAGTEAATSPFLSPDGNWLGFRDTPSRTLKKVALTGGAPVTIVPPSEVPASGNWYADDKIYFRPTYPSGLVRVASSGGPQEPVSKLDDKKEERAHSSPVMLPGGKTLLYTAAGDGMDSYDDARITVQSLATGEQKVLLEGGMSATYSPTGHIVYARGGKLLAVPFDVDRLAVTGGPVPVLDGIFMCPNTGTAHFSLAANGTLAYAQGIVVGGERQPVWVDRRGKAESLAMPARAYLHPRLSPDGKLLAIEIEGPTHDFWVFDPGRGTMSKMSLTGSSHWPLWTPDGSRLTFRAWSQGHFNMWWMPSDRSANPERLFEDPNSQSASSWSPDGKALAFTQMSLDTGADVYVMKLEGDRKPQPFARTRFAEGSPKFSPDGRWIAYTSNESGRNEIYAQAYPGPGAKVQVSTEGGTDPVWKRNGGELFYRSGDKMMAVQVSTAGSLQASKPALLWTGRYAHGLGSLCGPPGTTSSNYDVTPDGQRFLMIRADEQAPAQINVVVNWTAELKRLMAEKKL